MDSPDRSCETLGPVRARATCAQNGTTLFGQSDLFTIGTDQNVNLPDILLGVVTPVPQSIAISAATTNLTVSTQTVQLNVVATYSDGSTQNISAGSTGVQYGVSNPAIATVKAPDGTCELRSAAVRPSFALFWKEPKAFQVFRSLSLRTPMAMAYRTTPN